MAGPQAVVDALEAAIATGAADRARISAAAVAHSWQARLIEIEAALRSGRDEAEPRGERSVHHREDAPAGERHRAAQPTASSPRSPGWRRPWRSRYVEFGAPEPAPRVRSMDAVTLSGGRAASRGRRRAAAFAAGARARQVPVRSRAGCVGRAGPDAAGGRARVRRGSSPTVPWSAAALLGRGAAPAGGLPGAQPRVGRIPGPIAVIGTLRRFERSVLRTFAESLDAHARRRRRRAPRSAPAGPDPIRAQRRSTSPRSRPVDARRRAAGCCSSADFTYAPNARGPGLSHRRGDARRMGERIPTVRLLGASAAG